MPLPAISAALWAYTVKRACIPFAAIWLSHFAHVRMVLTPKGRALQSRDGSKQLDDEALRNLRQRLLEHRHDFHELRELLEEIAKKKKA
jgi:hypothetical protein